MRHISYICYLDKKKKTKATTSRETETVSLETRTCIFDALSDALLYFHCKAGRWHRMKIISLIIINDLCN